MIFSIDPGSEKTGIAVLRDAGDLITKKIIPTESLTECLAETYTALPFSRIVMGNGTNHRHLRPVVEQWIAGRMEPIVFSLVDEKFTTVEGRRLYFKYTPRHGWRRFVPLSLQYPPEPVDDFVAWIIGLRYIRQQGGNL